MGAVDNETIRSLHARVDTLREEAQDERLGAGEAVHQAIDAALLEAQADGIVLTMRELGIYDPTLLELIYSWDQRLTRERIAP